MIVGVPDETAADETRVALTPPVAKKLVDRDVAVCVASGAGRDPTGPTTSIGTWAVTWSTTARRCSSAPT